MNPQELAEEFWNMDSAQQADFFNILADIIIPLQKIIPRFLKAGGIFISSGILDTKEEAVKEAIEKNPDLEIIETTYQGEWVSITTVKR